MDLTGRARRWNRCGYVVLLIVGAAWHFLFDLSGQNVVVGALTPVNESVWEHGKLLLFPICLWWLLGMALLRCAMIAFVEVSSFGIGTSTMYLATVHPLLLLYAFAALAAYGGRLRRKGGAA